MDDGYRGPFASLRQWNHRRIQKRRWLRDQWVSRDAMSTLQSSRVSEQADAPQAQVPSSDLLQHMPLPTKRSCLARLLGAGVVIDTVVDVGVHEAGTPELIAAFPRARHLLFEPMASMNPSIEKAYAGVLYELYNVACFSDDGQSYLVATCIDGSGRVTHTHVADTPDAPGIGEVVNSQPIRRVRLDSMNLPLGRHILLKVDVDGVDLEVLKGATDLLARSEVVIVEAPLWRLTERCDFLVTYGFQLYDIVDLCYYHSILSQVDVVFVRGDIFKRHPELEPWASKVFAWDAYKQLSVPLDAQAFRPGGLGAAPALTSAASTESVVTPASPVDATHSPSTLGPTTTARSGGQSFANNDVRVHGLLRDSGFDPAVIYDVGASNAGWSEAICERLFPNAAFHLFEPLAGTQASYAELLKSRLARHPSFRLHPVALGDQDATVDFWTDLSGFGSSALDVDGVSGFSRQTVPMVRLDDYVERQGLPLPDLIKLDVQGLEGQILRNAQRCMEHATVLQVECWFYPGYGPGTSLLHEIIDLVGEHGFELCELGDRYYSDPHRLYAVDAFFVKREWAVAHGRSLPIGNWVDGGGSSHSSPVQLADSAETAISLVAVPVHPNDGTLRLRAAHPWPDISALDSDPIHMWSLDGGGRELVEALLQDRRVSIVLEVGTVLGGSALRWLEAREGFTLIVLDSWSPAAAAWVDTIIADPPGWVSDVECLVPISGALKQHGIEQVALHNLRKYRDRVIPIKMTAEAGYAHVRSFVEPDLIYIDANKELLDYQLAHETFPNAILCGDDWTWQDSSGAYPVREYVNSIAELRDCTVISRGATWVLAPRSMPERLVTPAPQFARRASPRLTGPLDVVVTPNEMNDLHGTGFLVKRVFAGWSNVLSLRIRDDYGGAHDFGAEAHRLDIDPGRRPQVYAAALAAVGGRPVRAVYCVPFTSADLMLAMAVADVAQAPLCLWEMDDQCVALPNISRSLMREFLQKCRLRLATHTELRDAYEAAFGLRFGVLPAVVPAALVRPGVSGGLAPGAPGALLGSVWSSAWLVRLAAVLSDAGETLDWYGNHRSSWPRIDDATLAAMPLRTHGVVAEPALADALLGHPFAVVPTDALDGPPTVHTAIAELSLPGRILFAAASAQIPILVVGSDRTPAAAFVLRHGIGRVVPYDAGMYRAAVAELRDPALQAAMRVRAAALAPGLSDAGVGEWLLGSMEDGQPRDDRFERLFPRDSLAAQEIR